MKERKGFNFAEADPDKIIVSMLEFQGRLYVATQKGIYIQKEKDGKFMRLELVDETSPSVPLQSPESPVSG